MDRILFSVLFMIVPGIGGFLTMATAIYVDNIPLSILGLGLLIVALTMAVFLKLEEVHSAIRDSGEKTETVLKQRLQL